MHCTVLAMTASAQVFAAPAATDAPRLLVVGDSLSAEYGLARGSGWVALLEQRLAAEKRRYQVVNASISGDTSAGGKCRLPGLLKQHQPAIVIIELGANDALRGFPLNSTRDNLNAMCEAAQAAGAKVMLVGMQVPPNFGQQYTKDFAQVFVDVAQSRKAALLPFLLKGVADVPNAETLFQVDRIHPKAEAHPTLLNNVWPVLKPLLR